MKEMLLECHCHNDGSEKSVTKARLDNGGDEEHRQGSSQTESDAAIETGVEESVAHAAVFNADVLCHVWSFLPVRDLLECRVVCKTWNAVTSTTLRVRSTYLKKDIENIPALISSLKANLKFPFPGYQWSYVCDEQEKVRREFVSEFGHLFKRLRLSEWHRNFRFVASMKQCLKVNFSHVEVLDMSSLIRSSWEPINLQEFIIFSPDLEDFSLPELKRLILPSAIKKGEGIQTFVRHLIRAAPNLQRIDNFTAGLIASFAATGKINAVATMEFDYYDSDPETYMAIASAPPSQLSHLEIDPALRLSCKDRSVVWNALLSILIANRESLKSLKINCLDAFDGQLNNLPAFPNLQHLHVKGDAGNFPEDFRLFPENVCNIFPGLKTVTVELEGYPFNFGDKVTTDVYEGHILGLYLWSESLLSVTTLNILFAFDVSAMEFLADIFPNISSLLIDWEACFQTNYFSMLDRGSYREEDVWDVWKAPFKVRRLEIRGLNLWTQSDFSLDSFLTGIPESVCRNLRKQENLKLPIQPCHYNVLRGYPNMLNLKDSLRELVISFGYPPTPQSRFTMESAYEIHRQAVSSVSMIYGIKLMKSMRVYLAYDHRKFYSSSFRDFLAPLEGDNVILCHEEFPDPIPKPEY